MNLAIFLAIFENFFFLTISINFFGPILSFQSQKEEFGNILAIYEHFFFLWDIFGNLDIFGYILTILLFLAEKRRFWLFFETFFAVFNSLPVERLNNSWQVRYVSPRGNFLQDELARSRSDSRKSIKFRDCENRSGDFSCGFSAK